MTVFPLTHRGGNQAGKLAGWRALALTMAPNSAMDAERWRRIEELYHAARSMPENARARFLAQQCGEDESLHSEVQSLLSTTPTDLGAGCVPERAPPESPSARPAYRRLSGRGAHRRWRNGRGVSRSRCEARARRGDQDPAARVERRSRSPCAVGSRSACARLAQPSEHRDDSRTRGCRRRSCAGVGVG